MNESVNIRELNDMIASKSNFVNMITIFGWEQQNIDLLKQNWFTLE